MPRTADRVAREQPFGERAAVVGAGGADREHLVVAAQDHHRLAARVPQQRRLAHQVAFGDAGLEIGAGELRFVSTHAA